MDVGISRAVALRLAPQCAAWHRHTNIRPRWNEEAWASHLPGALYRDSGRTIAARLGIGLGLPGMNAKLWTILDTVPALLDEETEKAVRAWVKIYSITPKLAVGDRAEGKLLSGRITGYDFEQGLYFYAPDDPGIRYTDPRGIPVAYEILTPTAVEASTSGAADSTRDGLGASCGCLICQRRRIRSAIIAGVEALCRQTGPGSFVQGALPSLSSIARLNSPTDR
jgi:hypothetical protein